MGKQHLSFMLPKVMTIDSSIKTKYFDNQSCKVLDANLNHNCVTGLHNVGNSKVIAWLFCIMI